MPYLLWRTRLGCRVRQQSHLRHIGTTLERQSGSLDLNYRTPVYRRHLWYSLDQQATDCQNNTGSPRYFVSDTLACRHETARLGHTAPSSSLVNTGQHQKNAAFCNNLGLERSRVSGRDSQAVTNSTQDGILLVGQLTST